MVAFERLQENPIMGVACWKDSDGFKFEIGYFWAYLLMFVVIGVPMSITWLIVRLIMYFS